ncbi:sensor histidine kinase [Streptomyces sp. NA02950]|uniref:sensor histidine kinase n=1 Tax=Streptomyces sp. NA02950 TaxID=2742137 RepID=UPI00159135BC|nr:sensor histidine kinase [Streptomyces sp. NA02950]QKV94542.1 sensor histidine kinase [Streptomyces sp. NA02950]
MTQYIQDPAFWALIAGTPLAATAIFRGRKAQAKLRSEKAEVENRCTDLENHYSSAVQEAQVRAEEATKSALKSAMRTLQGLANEQQLAISKLQDRYGEHHILQDLLEIDHMNSQFGRRAQSIAVLCDGWLGRQRAVASVYDVVRSAKGRIRHYTRVEIRSQSNFALTSRAVEPVALALAELLDNATSYSAPDSPIDITIRTVPKGVCIIIDDAGVGMNEEEKNRADQLLSAQRATGVTGLGNPPQFGFAVIGVLAARYGFNVSVDSASPYGGVRAVVLLPEDLLTNMPEPEEPPVSRTPTADVPEEPASTAGGLPKRRRKGSISIVPREDSATAPARSSEETASIMGAFQRGTQSGRSANPNREGHDPQ